MRPRGMADHQHLIHRLGHRGGNAGAKLGHPRFQLRRIRPARLGRIGVIMHQVVGQNPGIPALKGQKHRPNGHPTGQKAQCPMGQERPQKRNRPPQHQRQHQLQDQHRDRIERSHHRPPAQLHQPKQRARADIGPSRAHQLQIGARNAALHRGFHNVRPDQHLDFGFTGTVIDVRSDLPTIRPRKGFRL